MYVSATISISASAFNHTDIHGHIHHIFTFILILILRLIRLALSRFPYRCPCIPIKLCTQRWRDVCIYGQNGRIRQTYAYVHLKMSKKSPYTHNNLSSASQHGIRNHIGQYGVAWSAIAAQRSVAQCSLAKEEHNIAEKDIKN